MFDYRFNRNAEEYAARLRREAIGNRLARAAAPHVAGNAARLFRTWADRLDAQARRTETEAQGLMPNDSLQGVTGTRKPHAYGGSGL